MAPMKENAPPPSSKPAKSGGKSKKRWAIENLTTRPKVMTEQRPLIRMGASNPGTELAAKATTTLDETIDESRLFLFSFCFLANTSFIKIAKQVGDRELDYKCWHRPEVMTEQ
nr:hypothetical protein [Tanacetum cinerariifolium]